MTREEAIRILKSKMNGSVDTSYEWAEAVRMSIAALSEPKTGLWIKVIDEETQNITKWHYECDQCGAGRWEKGQRYCQNCGAKMLGEDGDHNA